MTDGSQTSGPGVNAPVWDENLIFSALADPVRRQMLLTLARGGPQPASILMLSARRRLDATLKHLTAMRSAGLLITKPDPTDGRRMLYSLAPTIPLSKTEQGAVIDFGFCLLRL